VNKSPKKVQGKIKVPNPKSPQTLEKKDAILRGGDSEENPNGGFRWGELNGQKRRGLQKKKAGKIANTTVFKKARNEEGFGM